MATKRQPSAAADKEEKAAPAAKPAAPRKRSTPAASAKASTPEIPAAVAAAQAITAAQTLAPDVRAQHVAVAAYFIAEKNGFCSDQALSHWVEAEAQIDALIAQGAIKE